MEGPPWPVWLDKLFVRSIEVVQVGLFCLGVVMASLGLAMSAGFSPSWTASAITLIGVAVATSAVMALWAIKFKRPSMLTTSLLILVGVCASVATISAIIYVLVAQIDSPVTEYVICNWNQELTNPDRSEGLLALCTVTEQHSVLEYNCTDGEADLTIATPTSCQHRFIDMLHDELKIVNSIAYWTFIILLAVCQVNRKVIAQYHETDDPPDPFTKFIVIILLTAAFFVACFLVSLTIYLWKYSWTSAMFCFLGSVVVLVVSGAVYLLLENRKQLFIVANRLLVMVVMLLLPCCVFGGFFTGDLQSVTQMYHENWDEVFKEINKVFPGICNGLGETECKELVKGMTMQQLDNALLACLVLLTVVTFVILVTWRVLVTFAMDVMSLHGLSMFELGTLERTLFIDRQTITDAADVFWEVLHHPHRPINETLIQAKKAAGEADEGSHYGKLELQLKDKERARLRGLRKNGLVSSSGISFAALALLFSPAGGAVFLLTAQTALWPS